MWDEFLGCVLRDTACIQVVMVLKKEVMNSSNGGSNADSSDMANYRQCLVRTLHSCSIRFNSVAPAVVPLVSPTYPLYNMSVHELGLFSCWSSCRIMMKVHLGTSWYLCGRLCRDILS